MLETPSSFLLSLERQAFIIFKVSGNLLASILLAFLCTISFFFLKGVSLCLLLLRILLLCPYVIIFLSALSVEFAGCLDMVF